jgi:hypothetical protein
MRCWLADVTEAIETQRVAQQQAAVAARHFFCPRRPKYQSISQQAPPDSHSETSGDTTRTYGSSPFPLDDNSISTATYAFSSAESDTFTSWEWDPPECQDISRAQSHQPKERSNWPGTR